MAVTGQIGQENVILENAATEATLKLLLQATLATTKSQKEAIGKMAEKAGLDPASVEAANTGLTQTGSLSRTVGAAFGGLTLAGRELQQGFNTVVAATTKLTSGAAQASDVFGALTKLPFGIGLIASGFQQLAKVQESYLESYRTISNAGINFGGSLTDMRLAASNSYLTLEQFTSLMKNNSESLSRMGGSANEGAMAFAKVSKDFVENGDELRALGYTSEQLNQGLIEYISQTGGRSKEEMKNVKALSQGAGEYLEQLDRLADITGKNREEQEKAQKAAMFEADVQMTMARMSETDRKAFKAAMDEAGALYGQGGRDIVLAQAQGRAVTGEAGKMLTAIAPAAAKSIAGFQDAAKTYGNTSKEFRNISNQSRLEAQEGLGKIPIAAYSLNKGLQTLGDTTKTVSKDTMSGLTNKKAFDQQEADRAKNKEKQAKSEADTAAKTEAAMKQLSNQLLTALLPLFKILQPSLLTIINGLTSFAKYLAESPNLLKGLGAAVAALTAIFIANKVVQATSAVKSSALSVARTLGVAAAAPAATTVAQTAAGTATGAAGGGIGGMIRGIGMALAALGPAAPMIAAGAAAVGAAIVLIGAGIAGATWLMGKALPTLAEGLKSFGTINGGNLVLVGAGLLSLSAGLAAFGVGSTAAGAGTVIGSLTDKLSGFLGGKSTVDKIKEYAALGPGLTKAGQGILDFNAGLAKLVNTDVGKIDKITTALIRMKTSIPEKSLATRTADMIESVVTKVAATATAPATEVVKPAENNLSDQVQRLNTLTTEMLKVMKETADNTKNAVAATKALSNNVWA